MTKKELLNLLDEVEKPTNEKESSVIRNIRNLLYSYSDETDLGDLSSFVELKNHLYRDTGISDDKRKDYLSKVETEITTWINNEKNKGESTSADEPCKGDSGSTGSKGKLKWVDGEREQILTNAITAILIIGSIIFVCINKNRDFFNLKGDDGGWDTFYYILQSAIPVVATLLARLIAVAVNRYIRKNKNENYDKQIAEKYPNGLIRYFFNPNLKLSAIFKNNINVVGDNNNIIINKQKHYIAIAFIAMITIVVIVLAVGFGCGKIGIGVQIGGHDNTQYHYYYHRRG